MVRYSKNEWQFSRGFCNYAKSLTCAYLCQGPKHKQGSWKWEEIHGLWNSWTLKGSRTSRYPKILSERVTDEERKRKKLHRVFEISSNIKPCYNRKFILQKLDYMHRNPVSGKWNLAASFLEYPHSSAAFYELNERHPQVEIIHYEEVGASVSSPSGDDTWRLKRSMNLTNDIHWSK